MISLVTRDDRACTRQTSLPPNLTATERKGNEDNARNIELALASATDSYDAAAATAAATAAAAATLETV